MPTQNFGFLHFSKQKFFIYTLLLILLNYLQIIQNSPSKNTSSNQKNLETNDLEKEEENDSSEIKLPTHLDEEEYRLISITENNFNEIISKVPHFFLFIHNPWCKWSQKMDERLLNIHKLLKLELQPYYIGLLDSSLVKINDFLDKFIPEDILHVPRVYPKLIYFQNSEPVEVYSDKHNRDSLLNYIKRKIYPDTIKLPILSIFDFKIIHDKHAFIYVNQLADKPDIGEKERLNSKETLELFSKIARNKKNSIFYNTQDKKIIDYLFSKNSTFTNSTIYNRDLNVLYFSKGKLLDVHLNDRVKILFDKSLNYFISKQINTILYNKLNEDAVNEIFIKKQPAFFLFRTKFDNSTDYLEQNLPLLASQELQIKFVVTDIVGKFELKLAKLLLISNKDLPSIRLIDFNGGFRRYEYEGDFSIENVMEFVKNWRKGELKPYYSSQNIKQDEMTKKKEIVRRIGNANFFENVIHAKRNVMVLFYTNWCSHCKKVKIFFILKQFF